MTLWRGHFWPKGYNLNNLGRNSLDVDEYQISRAWDFWFQTRRFLKVFPFISPCKICGPLGRAILAQWLYFEQIRQRFTRQSCVPNIKDLGLLVLNKKIFKGFPYISLCKTSGPLGGPFLAQGLQFEHSWKGSTRWRCTPNIKGLGLLASDKKIFKGFPLYKSI